MSMNRVATSRIGMWHRPFETNLEEVKRTLFELHELGVTDLFVETYFNGQLIFSSEHALLPMHSFVGDYDSYGNHLLRAFIEEAKSFHIQIHAWVEIFFVGRFEHMEDSPWYTIHKDWILKNRDGSYLQKNEVNYLFLDPANLEVQTYIHHLYDEIVHVFGIASLHLDYIRYPLMYRVTPPDIDDDVGYNEASLNTFAAIHHIQGSLHEALSDPMIYPKWCLYRIHIIDRFVEDIYHLAHKQNVYLSAAVFGDPHHAIKHKMQDWYTWLKKGWLDLILPMAYYKDATRVFDEVKRMKAMVPDRVTLMAGIAPFMMHLSSQDHKDQITAALDAGAQGVAMFASQHYLSHHFIGKENDRLAVIELFKTIFHKEKIHETMD